jgi:hypothetical protein
VGCTPAPVMACDIEALVAKRLPATPQRVKALLNATTAQRKRHAAAEG